jgi:hypothetical protein
MANIVRALAVVLVPLIIVVWAIDAERHLRAEVNAPNDFEYLDQLTEAMCAPWGLDRALALQDLVNGAAHDPERRYAVADQAQEVTREDCVREGYPDPGEEPENSGGYGGLLDPFAPAADHPDHRGGGAGEGE